jgi:adenosine deaminase
VKLGDLAQYVLDKRIPLEICLLSNVHIGPTSQIRASEQTSESALNVKFRLARHPPGIGTRWGSVNTWPARG